MSRFTDFGHTYRAERLSEPASPPDSVGEAALPPELADALATLPPKQRHAVEMLRVEGLTVAEAALRAGVTKSALKVRAHRGYRTLRKRLGDVDRAGGRPERAT